jgi:hypothetical protein
MSRWARRLAVVAVTVVSSELAFWQLLQISRPAWKTSEYPAMAVWSFPLGFLILLVAKLPRRWLSRSNAVLRSLISVVLAAISSILWTYLAVALTGGYALAFDANPFLCWSLGSLIGMLTAMNWPLTRENGQLAREAAI